MVINSLYAIDNLKRRQFERSPQIWFLRKLFFLIKFFPTKFFSIKITTYLTLAVTITLLNTACQSEPQNSQITNNSVTSNSQVNSNFPGKTGTNGQQKLEKLNVAIIPSQDSPEQTKQRQKLANYLEKALGIPVNFQITKDYDGSVDLLVAGKVEVAFLSGFTYVKARQRNPQVEPILAPIEKGTDQPWYKSVIVVNAGSGISKIEDLKGNSFSFVNPSSTSGYLVPSAYLKTVGINPKQDFTTIQFAGSHNKNVNALKNGKVKAITINQPTYLNAVKKGKLPTNKYKLIWESDPIPNAPIVISSQLPSQFKINLQKALIDAPKDLIAVSGAKSDGYTLVQDEDYEPIRKLQKYLEQSAE